MPTRLLLLLHLTLLLAAATTHVTHASSSSFCVADLSFCVTGTTIADASSSSSSLCLTLQTTATGWVGLGIGSSLMQGADMLIGWSNTTGGITLSQRLGTGHILPSFSPINPTVRLSPLPAQAILPAPSAGLIFTVCRPFNLSTSSISPSTPYIYAYSNAKPLRPNDPTSSFPIHLVQDNFSADLTQSNNITGNVPTLPILQLPDGIGMDYIWRIHGILMFVAWAVSPFAGIFVARFMKDRLGVWWYRLHLFFMLIVTGSLTIASIILLYLYFAPPHFSSPHGQVGLAIGIAMCLQFILGFVSNHMWSPDRKTIPWWDKLHWWFGRGIYLLAIANIYLGMLEYEVDVGEPISTALYACYWTWIGVCFAALIAAQIWIGQVHHGDFEDSHKPAKSKLMTAMGSDDTVFSASPTEESMPVSTGGKQ